MRCRVALLLGLLLSLPSPVKGAALSKASLQGNYFFVYQKIDPNLAFGHLLSTATGTLTFDGKGGVNVQGSISHSNFNSLQPFAGSGTYTLDSSGTVQFSLPVIPLNMTGSISFDLNSLVTTNIGSESFLLSQEILLATRLPSPLVGEAFLKGKYFLAERTIITNSSGTPSQFENAEGTITFDGEGNFTLGLQRNNGGATTTVNDPGRYLISGTGSFLLRFPGRNDPVQVGFTENGSFGVGTTVFAGSNSTHDLFVLNKADGSGLGNAGLNGSYEMVVATFQVNTGFAMAAGLVDYNYKEDGSGLYQFAQNDRGIVETKQAATTFSVANDGSLQVQFAELLTSPNPFQGGLGAFGYSLVGASVNDSSIYNFLVAVRTPSQPAAATNAGSFSGSTALSPGGLFTIFGRNLARQKSTERIEDLYVSCPGPGEPNCLPKQLGGATVKIGGIEAPLRFVSPFQINAQAPFELPVGQTSISIVLDGVESGPLPATVNAAGPGLFTLLWDGKGMGVFQHYVDSSLVTESNPARPGETIIIYATGLGAVLPGVASGVAAPANPPSQATGPVSVQIGGKDSKPSFAGLTSKFVGLYQINTPIPPDITSAQTLSVVVTAGGIQSNTVTIPVSP